MDSKKFISFVGLRDLTISWYTRQVNISLKKVLETHRQEVLADDKSLLVSGNLLLSAPKFAVDYIFLRDKLFPSAPHLFPTVDGQQYYATKFAYRMKRMLNDAGTMNSPTHPKELKKEQYKALIEARFSIQRFDYQVTLVATFCAFLGMRPGEVASLTKADLDFGNRIIHLRDTKSQVPQNLPLLELMVEPLERYTAHLSDKAPLFINTWGMPWSRRIVTDSINEWANALGVTGVTSRKLRASLGAMLSSKGIPPALLAKILRHKDPATALRHYNQLEIEEARTFLENVTEQETTLDETFYREYERFYVLLDEEE